MQEAFQRLEKDLGAAVAQLWSWYTDELQSSLDDFVENRNANPFSSNDSHALLVDLTTAARIASEKWTLLSEAMLMSQSLRKRAQTSMQEAVSESSDLFDLAAWISGRVRDVASAREINADDLVVH